MNSAPGDTEVIRSIYHKDQTIEEWADLPEVIHAAVTARGYTPEDLERVRADKAAKRGRFEKSYYG